MWEWCVNLITLSRVSGEYGTFFDNCDKDVKFKIIEQIENTSLPNISNILLQRDDSWILKLKTLTPQKLNTKLNNPDQNIL